jgi:AraC-like DNA-binding protein
MRQKGPSTLRPSTPLDLDRDAGFLSADIRSQLIRHFDEILLTRFEELTGHRLHLLWHEPLEFHDPAQPPVLCPVALARLDSGLPLSNECATCQRDHWCSLVPATGHGRPVRGACGAHGFWAGVRVGPLRPLTLVLHAAVASASFSQAVILLLQVLRKVETSLAAELARRELDQALSHPPLPDPPSYPEVSHPAHAHGPHATATVRAMLDHVHAHFHRPLDLADLAATLGMNASYLSSLFVAAMGVRFHHYLSEFRLAKAMELLRDPLRRISEVAATTGYTSPNHFNNVFRTMTGVSPSAWRDANPGSDPPENATPGRKSKKS